MKTELLVAYAFQAPDEERCKKRHCHRARVEKKICVAALALQTASTV